MVGFIRFWMVQESICLTSCRTESWPRVRLRALLELVAERSWSSLYSMDLEEIAKRRESQMSSSMYQRQVQQIQSAFTTLQRNKGQKGKRRADLVSKINASTRAASRTSSVSVIDAKLREQDRLNNELVRVEKSLADIETKIAMKQKNLHDAQTKFGRAREREEKEQRKHLKRKEHAQSQQLKKITDTVEKHDVLHDHTLTTIEAMLALPEKIVVLFLAANPRDTEPLALDEEVRSISQKIRLSEHRDSVDLRSSWAVQPTDVLQAINEFRPTIIHFSGHGSPDGDIVFTDDRGQAKCVSKEAIVQTMLACSGAIQLVFFNTCYSREQAEAVISHVDAAVGMTNEIDDDAARVFAAQFYSAIGFGLSVHQAFEQSKAILMMEGISNSAVPELFTGPDVDADSLFIVRPPDDQRNSRDTK